MKPILKALFLVFTLKRNYCKYKPTNNVYQYIVTMPDFLLYILSKSAISIFNVKSNTTFKIISKFNLATFFFRTSGIFVE